MSSSSDSKKSIVQAAAKLFARLGLDKCSTREIAKQSESNISLISYYFGGKEGLYKEVMRNHALEIKEAVQEAILRFEAVPLTQESFSREISMMVEMMIRMNRKNPEMAQIFAREKLIGMPFSKDVQDEVFYPIITRFLALFKSAQENKIVKQDLNGALFFVAMSEAIWGFFEMHACNTKLNKDFGDLAENHSALRDQILKIYLTGALI